MAVSFCTLATKIILMTVRAGGGAVTVIAKLPLRFLCFPWTWYLFLAGFSLLLFARAAAPGLLPISTGARAALPSLNAGRADGTAVTIGDAATDTAITIHLAALCNASAAATHGAAIGILVACRPTTRSDAYCFCLP